MRHLERHRGDHDLFVFFSYRYYPTYHGLRAVRDKALLVPTCEEDGVYRLPSSRRSSACRGPSSTTASRSGL